LTSNRGIRAKFEPSDQIVRVRFEAKGHSQDAVKDTLLHAVQDFRDRWQGTWEQEESQILVIATSDRGWWGHMTIRRIP
jgi:hypothetical protein